MGPIGSKVKGTNNFSNVCLFVCLFPYSSQVLSMSYLRLCVCMCVSYLSSSPQSSYCYVVKVKFTSTQIIVRRYIFSRCGPYLFDIEAVKSSHCGSQFYPCFLTTLCHFFFFFCCYMSSGKHVRAIFTPVNPTFI